MKIAQWAIADSQGDAGSRGRNPFPVHIKSTDCCVTLSPSLSPGARESNRARPRSSVTFVQMSPRWLHKYRAATSRAPFITCDSAASSLSGAGEGGGEGEGEGGPRQVTGQRTARLIHHASHGA